MATTVADINLAGSVTFPPYQEAPQELNNVFSHRLDLFKRIALRVLGNTADAEDAVQDAFLSAYKHLDPFKGQSQLSTWLTTTVLNMARMRVRQRRWRFHIALDAEDREQGKQPFWMSLTDRRPSPEEVCQRSEVRKRIPQSLMQLPRPLRRTIQLCEMDGLSIREAAHIMGVPEGTVEACLARARTKLKLLVQKRRVRPERDLGQPSERDGDAQQISWRCFDG